LPHAEPVADWDALCARMDRPMRIGTSSVRRAAQLRTIFRRAAFLPLRGNVETRLRKLDAGECDATVLACAGLKRLGLGNRISLALPIGACIPAPGQGIVAVQIRENPREIAEVVSRIGDRDAMDALVAERAIVRALGGGCQMALGAHARIDGDDLEVDAIVTSADGHRTVRETARGHRRDAVRIGESLANTLLQKGAAEILEM
jgi:hydroxymethylbilane synthase